MNGKQFLQFVEL